MPRPRTLRTAEAVIEALGGKREAAKIMQITFEGVCNQVARQRIDPRHYFKLRPHLERLNAQADESVFRVGDHHTRRAEPAAS